ncbi:MAG: hypothetical protein IPH02_16710 [Sphingobacteriales bacterium]|nr:hypothetical protein [Sphingobacteriales bacterium]
MRAVFALLIYKKEIMDFVMPTLVIAAIGYVAYHIKQLGAMVGQKLLGRPNFNRI